MAEEAVKNDVVAILGRLQSAQPGSQNGPLVEAANLGSLRVKLGVGHSTTKLGDALRSLHNAGVIRCARPREAPGEPRPYALYLLNRSE